MQYPTNLSFCTVLPMVAAAMLAAWFAMVGDRVTFSCEQQAVRTSKLLQTIQDPQKLRTTLGELGTTNSGRSTLVALGTGLRLGHLTMETIQEIESADMVMYVIADEVTKHWLIEKRPDSFDLYMLYKNGKNRDETYVQMAEAMIAPVRLGFKVAAVVYGHPGVFATPTHRAVAIARSEGLSATMFAGISTSDCLYADLGVDPARPGMLTLEATDVVLRPNSTIDSSRHVVIYQISSIGDPGFNKSGFANDKFSHFIDVLVGIYGKSFEVILYVASTLVVQQPQVERISLGSLRGLPSKVQKDKVTGVTTMYLPPKSVQVVDGHVAAELQLSELMKEPRLPSGYGVFERAAIANLSEFVVPAHYAPSSFKSLWKLLKEISLNPKAMAAYDKDPNAVSVASGLSSSDSELLLALKESGWRNLTDGPPQGQIGIPQIGIQIGPLGGIHLANGPMLSQ